MLKDGLSSLLGSKTREGRERALGEIGRWKETAAAIREAEREAQFDAGLDAELLNGYAKAENEAQAAGYIGLVGLAQQAVENRRRALSLATAAFEREVKLRATSASKAKKESEVAADTHRKLLAGADHVGTVKRQAARSSPMSVVRSIGRAIAYTVFGAILGFGAYFIIGLCIGVSDCIHNTNTNCLGLFVTLMSIGTGIGFLVGICGIASAVSATRSLSDRIKTAEQAQTKAVDAAGRDVPDKEMQAASEAERLDRAKWALGRLRDLSDA